MKKKFTALFIATVLALSAVSAVVPTAAESGAGSAAGTESIEVGTDLMPLASTTAAKINVDDGNGYLHIYDRYHNYSNPDGKGNPRIEAGSMNLVTAIGWQPAKDFLWNNKTVYYISLKARMATNWADQSEVGDSFEDDAATMYYKMYAGGNFLVFDFWKAKLNQWNSNATVDYTNSNSKNQTTNIAPPQFLDTAEMATYGLSLNEIPSANYKYKAYNDGVAVALTNEWTDLVFAFVPRFGDLQVGLSNKQHFVAFSSAAGAYRNIPVDIDDFEIYYYNGSQKQTLVSFDFNDIDNPSHGYEWMPGDRYNKMFAVNGATRNGYNRHFKVANIKEYDYLEAAAPVVSGVKQAVKDGTIAYIFPENTRLDAGIYEFTAEARLNFYDGYLDDTQEIDGKYPVQHKWQFIENEDNTARLEIKDNYGNSWGREDITSEWSEVKYTFTVPKGMDFTLSSVEALFSDDTASVNKAFNLRNVTLIKTEALVYDSEFQESEADMVYTVEDDAFAVSRGSADAKIQMVYPASYTEGNKYLTVSGRTNERDGFILDLRGIVDNSTANDYRLSFRVRASRALSNLKISSADRFGYDPSWTMVKLSAGLYRGGYVEAAPATFQPNGQSASYYRHRLGNTGAYWWYFSNDEWHTVDIPFNDFVQDEEGVSTRYNVIHFGGAETAYNAVDFDIDDITVYSTGAGEIWKQDFQGVSAGELLGELAGIFVPFKETWLSDSFRTEEVSLSVGEDAPYYTANGVSEVKYTVPDYAPTVLEPGTYTIHADFSYPGFDGDRITVDVGSARLRNYIKEDNNKFSVRAIVETENGSFKLKSHTVENDWTECKFRFSVEKPMTVKSVSFVFKDASGAEYTTVCYRNVYIDGNYPEGPAIPNPGIVMMLLLKKNYAAAEGQENTENARDRALSDRDVVYSIIDSSFKVTADGRTSRLKTEYPGSFENGNRYLRVSGRTNNRDGIIIDLRRAVLDVSDAEYRLSFRIRSAAAISDIWSVSPTTPPFAQKDSIRLGEGLYNGAYTPASPSIFGKATITSAGFDPSLGGWYFDNNSWTTVDVSFAELKNQNVIHIGGGALGCNASDFDIDDVMIYIDGEEEPIYIEDFEDADTGALSSNLSYFYVPFTNGNVSGAYREYGVAMEIEEDRDYLTAGDASELRYTAPEDAQTSLAAGEYTIHASFSYPFYDGKAIDIAQTDDSKKQSYFKSNTNAFDVTAVIETEDGTFSFDKYTVRNSWADCEFDFKLEDDIVIRSVSFKLTPADGEASTAVCLRDVYIDGDLAE